MDFGNREMTLNEWVDSLPAAHGARRELADLRSQLFVAYQQIHSLEVRERDQPEQQAQGEWRQRANDAMAIANELSSYVAQRMQFDHSQASVGCMRETLQRMADLRYSWNQQP